MRFSEDIYALFLWPLLSLVTCNPLPTTITRPCLGQFDKRSIAGDSTDNGCLKYQTSLLILYLEMAREKVNTTNTKISGYVDVDPNCNFNNQTIINDLNTTDNNKVVEASLLFYYPVLLNTRSQIEKLSSNMPIGSPITRPDISAMATSIDRCMCSMSMIIGQEIMSVNTTRDLDTMCTDTCTDTASGQLTMFICQLNTVLKESHLILNKMIDIFTEFTNTLNCNQQVLTM